jgi:hypothetical protein
MVHCAYGEKRANVPTLCLFVLRTVLAGALLFAGTQYAAAQLILPPLGFFLKVPAGNLLDVSTSPGTLTSDDCPGGGPCAVTATASDTGLVSTAGGASNIAGAGGYASFSFNFEVVGGNGSTVSVPMFFNGAINTTVSGVEVGVFAQATAVASVAVYTQVGEVADLYSCSELAEVYCSGSPAGTAPSAVNVPFTIEANTVGNVAIGVEGTGTAQQVGASGEFSATADPIVAIQPSFLASHPGYSLVFDQGYQPPSAVPEPSTWAMLIVGFAGLGYAGLRRSRARRAAKA